MVLHADVTLVVFAAAVVQELEGQGPVLLTELGGLQHVGPLLGPQVVFEDLHVVLEVDDGALVHEDLGLVPLAERVLVLRNGRNHVIQGGGLTVAVHAEEGVRMVRVVQHLVLRSGDIDGLVALVAVLVLGGDFLREVEDTGVAALGDLPFELEGEILELVGEDDVAALAGLAFAGAGASELQAAVVDGPAGREFLLAVTAPSLRGSAVKEDDITIVIDLEIVQVHLGGVDDRVFGNGGLSRLLLSLVAAGNGGDHQRSSCCKHKNLFHGVMGF